jgi:hypothetical protein
MICSSVNRFFFTSASPLVADSTSDPYYFRGARQPDIDVPKTNVPNRHRQARPHTEVPEAARTHRPAPPGPAACRHANARRRARPKQPLKQQRPRKAGVGSLRLAQFLAAKKTAYIASARNTATTRMTNLARNRPTLDSMEEREPKKT